MTDKNIKPESQTVKIIKRLRNDPEYQEIEKNAQQNPQDVGKYAEKVIEKFKLDVGWKLLLQYVLLNKNFEAGGMTGASIQPYIDPITSETRYFIPVNPETTQDNVLSIYNLIQSRYKEAGSNKRMRKDNPMKTDIQLYAYRRSVDGLANKEIQVEIKDVFGEELRSFEITELIKEGKAKKLG